jgi:hypothetical protein
MNITNRLFATILLFISCFGSAQATENPPSVILKVESKSPLQVSALIQGRLYKLSLPVGFMSQVDGLYSDVYVDDLNGNGKRELVFDLIGSDVNHCSKVLHYNENDRSFSEWLFKGGGLCNPISRGRFLISSYRDGASWTEDVYTLKNGKPEIHITDSCVGCSEVRRKMYTPGKQPVKVLVSDHIEFERRIPLTASITSPRARVFSSPDSNWPTKKYLIRGDEITLVEFDKSEDGEDWAEFKFIGTDVATDGWVKYSDLE